MVALDHPHLKKKMCRYMLESLQKLVPGEDFSRFKAKYSEDKDMPKEIHGAFKNLLTEYLALQEKMSPEKFKESFLAWVNKAHRHVASVC